jgi:DGQHR domain-containing protein
MQVARIERIGRDAKGRLSGFQRPQIAAHIREIGDYLGQDDAMLPNAIVLAFAKGASATRDGGFVVDISDGPPGWVVDGQQRLCAALRVCRLVFPLRRYGRTQSPVHPSQQHPADRETVDL